MAVNQADLEAIKQAIIGAINSAAGTAGTGTTVGDPAEIARLEAYVDTLNRANSALDRQEQRAQSLSNATERQNELNRIRIERQQNLIEGHETQLALNRQHQITDAAIAAQIEQQIELQEQVIAGLEEDNRNRERAVELTQQQKAALDSLAGSMAGMVRVYGQHNHLNVSAIKGMVETIKTAGPMGAAIGAVKGVFTGLVDTMINLSFQLDEAESSFVAMTGASRAMAESISADRAEAQRLGIEVGELFDAHKALRQEMSIFSGLQPEVQRQVGLTGAALEKQGVSMSDFAKVTELGMKAFGMGAIQASEASIQLNQLARDIGVTPQQMSQDFASAAGELTAFGSAGVNAFKELAITSKKSGLEVDKLLRISEGFDTFEGAATSAGKLNAALGGNFVNAMDLMMAKEPAKRFEMIRDAVMQTGKTFDDMEYFEKKFYVNAIDGIDSVADLALLMSDNFQDLSKDTNMTAADFEALAKQTKDIQTVMDSLKNLFASQLAPILNKDVIPAVREAMKQFDQGKGPIADIVNVLKIFTTVILTAAKHIKTTGALMFLYFFGPSLLKGVKNFKFFSDIFDRFGGSVEEVGDQISGSFTESFSEIAEAAGRNAKGIMALGAAMVFVGLGVALAAAGTAQLAAAFGQVGDNAMAAVGGIVAFGATMVGAMIVLAKLTPATTAATLGILAFGGAVTLLGFGVKLAAEGIAEMAVGFGTLFASLTTDNTENFTTFITDISGNAANLAIAAAGLILMSKGVTSLASAMSAIPMETLEKLGNLGGIGVDVEVSGATENIKAMMGAINEVDTIKLAAASLMVTAATAGNVATATAPAPQAMAQKQQDTNVDVKVYIDGKQMTAEAVTAVNNEIVRRTTGK